MNRLIINNIEYRQFNETRFWISDNGEVYSTSHNKIIKPTFKRAKGKKTYLCITLMTKDRIRKNYSIHRLVGLLWVDNPNNLPCINHIDSNKLNNSASNLEWCSTLDNNLHALKAGKKSKYSIEDLTKAKELLLEGMKPRDIIKQVNMPVSVIYNMKCKDSWSYL